MGVTTVSLAGALVAVDDVVEEDEELAPAHAGLVTGHVSQRLTGAEPVGRVGRFPRRLSVDQGGLSEDGAVQRSVVAEHSAIQISELYNQGTVYCLCNE